MKFFRLVVMAVAFVALAVFTVLHARSGLETQTSKLDVAFFIILMVWAASRVFSIANDLFQK